MRREKLCSALVTSVMALLAALVSVSCAWAVQETVLYSFTGGNDGGNPYAGLILDSAGNLYGTTRDGGMYGYGTVFELSPANGSWTETVLYSFTGGSDGSTPYAGLTFDAAGNLYGTTLLGGANNDGCVFELTPNSGGWTETILHTFVGYPTDGTAPYGGVIFDQAGNLYGTTVADGTQCRGGCGTVFELTPGSGGWTETILYNFCSKTNCPDGSEPRSGVSLDAEGNLYGTTAYGGALIKYGTVFKLTPNSGGSWTESVLHSFDRKDGANPFGGVILDKAGSLYGTTTQGGGRGIDGTVFRLKRSASHWALTMLYRFAVASGQFAYPYAGLVFDKAGNLYGTTFFEGASSPGSVFKLGHAKGSWKEKWVYGFTGRPDGAYPGYGSLIFDQAGNLYGTTIQGGTGDSRVCQTYPDGCGTVFKIAP
jgi:uncharacterized repeat protein (TIGR03803 family)